MSTAPNTKCIKCIVKNKLSQSPYISMDGFTPHLRELLTLAWEYHYDNHACHTYIFPPRWPTLQQNIKVNRGENCVGDTCGTWHQRSFTTVHVVCMYNQPFSIFLWWWCHMERHYGGLPAEAMERHLYGTKRMYLRWVRQDIKNEDYLQWVMSYIVLSKCVMPLKMMSFWDQGCN